MITLRPYQKIAIDNLRVEMLKGNKRIILSAPTGSGKTVIFCSMVNPNKRVFIFTDRKELLTQAGGALNNNGLTPTEVVAGEKINRFR
jgi:superfamily II DNA or RNA helicase